MILTFLIFRKFTKFCYCEIQKKKYDTSSTNTMFAVIRSVSKVHTPIYALRSPWNTLSFSTSTGVQQSQRDNKHYDVIIVGGGMVGTTLACSLGE
jgi:hypothetical protein